MCVKGMRMFPKGFGFNWVPNVANTSASLCQMYVIVLAFNFKVQKNLYIYIYILDFISQINFQINNLTLVKNSLKIEYYSFYVVNLSLYVF